MADHHDPAQLGPYELRRPLAAGGIAERWLALHTREQTSHTVFRLGPMHDRAEQRRFLAAVQSVASLHHPHLLRVDQFTLDIGGRGWVVCPYTGHQKGLVTLAGLLEAKGGRMEAVEAERAIDQLLEAVEYAHDNGHHHGPVRPGEIQIDRRGSVLIELYGLSRQLHGLAPANEEIVRDEVRSIVEIGYRLLTGLDADEPRIPATRLVRRLGRHWDQWFDDGLDAAGGFETPAAARAALPSARQFVDIRPNVARVVLSRMSKAIGTSRSTVLRG